MCYTYLTEISRAPDGDDGAGQKAAAKTKKLRADPLFQAVMKEIEMQRNRGFSTHPKMDMLKTLVVQHFAEKIVDEGDRGAEEDTRVMVFVTYRECVDEIVETLNHERPLIRATKFVGQGTDKQGNKGIAQKEQLEVRILIISLWMINIMDLTNILEPFVIHRSSKNSRPESTMYLYRPPSAKRGSTLVRST